MEHPHLGELYTIDGRIAQWPDIVTTVVAGSDKPKIYTG
jgi:hypothetical protein